MNYNEALAAGIVDTTKFTVTYDGALVNVTAASASGTKVTVTMQFPVLPGNVVLLTYIGGGSGNRIQDAAGNFAGGFTNSAVTNNVV